MQEENQSHSKISFFAYKETDENVPSVMEKLHDKLPKHGSISTDIVD
jgi:hypothetical protein